MKLSKGPDALFPRSFLFSGQAERKINIAKNFCHAEKDGHTLEIGSITLASAAALAPMAGVADRAFRELCVRFGAAYVVGEMVSAKGITMGDRKSAELLSLSEAERPAAIQLFGDDPSIMAEAAQKALFYRPQAIDINMGCPAPKVVRSGGGSSLMRRPETAQAVVEAAVRAVDIPVTVKSVPVGRKRRKTP